MCVFQAFMILIKILLSCEIATVKCFFLQQKVIIVTNFDCIVNNANKLIVSNFENVINLALVFFLQPIK